MVFISLINNGGLDGKRKEERRRNEVVGVLKGIDCREKNIKFKFY